MQRVSPLLDGGRRDVIEIDRVDLDEAVGELAKLPLSRGLVATLSAWSRPPIARRFERLARQIQSLARRLGQPAPTVALQGERSRLERERWQAFWAAMAHVVRNAVSHGIETPAERHLEPPP